jgi:predicted transcriptional regulator
MQGSRGSRVPDVATTIELTADVVAAYVGNHQIGASELPGLIRAVYGAFADEPDATGARSAAELTKAQIRKSVTPDSIVSFEDGRRYKMLRRHLATHDLTPDTYRAKWGLPPDYPMVAPAYSAERSVLAKARGLGRRAPPLPSSAAPAKARKPRTEKAPDVDPTKTPAVRPPRPKKSGA